MRVGGRGRGGGPRAGCCGPRRRHENPGDKGLCGYYPRDDNNNVVCLLGMGAAGGHAT